MTQSECCVTTCTVYVQIYAAAVVVASGAMTMAVRNYKTL